MDRQCPHPWCAEGLVPGSPRGFDVRQRPRRCPVCHGRGSVDETAEDLHAAGIVVPEPTEEDFRSSPFHTPS